MNKEQEALQKIRDLVNKHKNEAETTHDEQEHSKRKPSSQETFMDIMEILSEIGF